MRVGSSYVATATRVDAARSVARSWTKSLEPTLRGTSAQRRTAMSASTTPTESTPHRRMGIPRIGVSSGTANPVARAQMLNAKSELKGCGLVASRTSAAIFSGVGTNGAKARTAVTAAAATVSSNGRQVPRFAPIARSEEHTSELQSRSDLVCRLLLEKKKIQFAGGEEAT